MRLVVNINGMECPPRARKENPTFSGKHLAKKKQKKNGKTQRIGHGAQNREEDKEAARGKPRGKNFLCMSAILLPRSRTAGSVIDCINFPVCHGTHVDEKRLHDGRRESEGESGI